MTTTTFTPEQHLVFNEFDQLGLLLGLPRLEAERNPEYKQRLLDVFVNRSGSSYRGLVNGITRELGLSLFEAFRIRPKRDSNGNLIGDNPAVVLNETRCYVYSDFTLGEDGIALTIDRFDSLAEGFTLNGLINLINSTGYFSCDLTGGVPGNTRAMTVLNQSTLSIVASEELDKSGSRIKLNNANLISNSITIRSSTLIERVDSLSSMLKTGQYYVDSALGIIYSTVAPSPGSIIRYQYRDDDYAVISSPVIIHNIQSDDFRSRMFEQQTINGITTNGAVSALGAELIDELLSVFPTGWGN